MDTLAHGIIGVLGGKTGRSRVDWRWLGFFGMLPDLIWIPFTMYSLLVGRGLVYHWSPYNVSHSLILWVLVCGLVSVRWRKTFLYTWPYAAHLLVDIPGHIDMPTPILWPVSHWHITGWFDWLSLPMILLTYIVFGVWSFVVRNTTRTVQTK
jgi:hypothetical protein